MKYSTKVKILLGEIRGPVTVRTVDEFKLCVRKGVDINPKSIVGATPALQRKLFFHFYGKVPQISVLLVKSERVSPSLLVDAYEMGEKVVLSHPDFPLKDHPPDISSWAESWYVSDNPNCTSEILSSLYERWKGATRPGPKIPLHPNCPQEVRDAFLRLMVRILAWKKSWTEKSGDSEYVVARFCLSKQWYLVPALFPVVATEAVASMISTRSAKFHEETYKYLPFVADDDRHKLWALKLIDRLSHKKWIWLNFEKFHEMHPKSPVNLDELWCRGVLGAIANKSVPYVRAVVGGKEYRGDFYKMRFDDDGM